MRNFTEEKYTPVVEAVPNPSPETGLGFGGVHTANRGVLPATFDLDGFENNPESPFDPVGFSHFIRLFSVRGVKCGGGHALPTFYTAMVYYLPYV